MHAKELEERIKHISINSTCSYETIHYLIHSAMAKGIEVEELLKAMENGTTPFEVECAMNYIKASSCEIVEAHGMNSYPLRIEELKSLIRKGWRQKNHVHEWEFTEWEDITGIATKGHCKTCRAIWSRERGIYYE